MHSIRLATDDDVPALVPLVERYWQFEKIQGFSPAGIETLLRGVASTPSRGACWVAANGHAIVGYLLVVFVFSLEHGGMMAEIDEFYVEADARSKGVGSQLLGVAERVLGRAGYVRLQMQIATDNERARGFYHRHGFTRRSGFDLWDKPLKAAP